MSDERRGPVLDGRWSGPWTAPVGVAPDREPGEPPYSVLAALHVGLLLGLSALVAILVPTVDDPSLLAAGGAAAVAGLTAVGGAVALQRRLPVLRWVADFCFAASALHVAGAAALLALVAGASDAGALLAAGLAGSPVAGLLYARLRRLWLQVATVGGITLALLSLVALGTDVPDTVDGLYLVLVGAFVAVGATSGVLRPVMSGYVLAAVVALAGAQVVLTGEAGLGYLVPVAVLAAVAALLVRISSASLLPVVLIGGVVLLPQVLGPLVGGARAFGLSLLFVGAGVAWLVVDLQRRSVRPQQTGGVFLTCTVLVLATAPILASQGDDLVALLACFGLLGFFAAAAAARRRPATVIAGLLAVLTVPGVLARPWGDNGVVSVLLQLGLAGLAVLVALLLDRRAPLPAAARPADWLSAPGSDALVDAPYPAVFDAAVRLLGTSGLPLQVVDRAAGRILAGPAERPVLGVGVWQGGPTTAHLRVVGQQRDVELFLRDLLAEVERIRVAVPH